MVIRNLKLWWLISLFFLLSCDSEDDGYCGWIRDYHKDDLEFCQNYNFDNNAMVLRVITHTIGETTETISLNASPADLEGRFYFLGQNNFSLEIFAQFSSKLDSLQINIDEQGTFTYEEDSIAYSGFTELALDKYSTLNFYSDSTDFTLTEVKHRTGCVPDGGRNHIFNFEKDENKYRLMFWEY